MKLLIFENEIITLPRRKLMLLTLRNEITPSGFMTLLLDVGNFNEPSATPGGRGRFEP